MEIFMKYIIKGLPRLGEHAILEAKIYQRFSGLNGIAHSQALDKPILIFRGKKLCGRNQENGCVCCWQL